MVKVNTADGELEGELLDNVLGGSYHSFKGIPYAAPPVGELRFQAPQPVKPWSGVRPAKAHGPICHQINLFTKTIVNGSEDCLYLNVYTPSVDPAAALPVIFYIHGGGFISYSGNSDILGPDFLINKGVVLVTFNYRLEVLGFLCLHTKDVPGNAGMKDQVAALRWVRKNIRSFGGDPDNITLCGQSAGAASVSYHLISPMTKGLFKRAIAMSGSCINYWSMGYEPRLRAEALAARLGKRTSNDKELYEFFKAAPVDQLVGVDGKISFTELVGVRTSVIFAVVDEKQYEGVETFFSGNPHEKMHKVHEGVDILTGYTTDEGILGFNFVHNLIHKFDNYYESFVPIEMMLQCSDPVRLRIGRKVREHYLGGKSVSGESIQAIVDFFSSTKINYPLYQWANVCSKTNNLYYYKFDVYTERNIFKHLFDVEQLIDNDKQIVTHCDELPYLFNMEDIPVDENSRGYEMIHRITKLWTNFVKFGNPTHGDNETKWPLFDSRNQNYANINHEVTITSHPDKEEFEFWDSIYQEHYPLGYHKDRLLM